MLALDSGLKKSKFDDFKRKIEKNSDLVIELKAKHFLLMYFFNQFTSLNQWPHFNLDSVFVKKSSFGRVLLSLI